MDIRTMPAGLEMDALVAEKVMGWRVHFRNTAWWVKAEEENKALPTRIASTCGIDRWSPSTNMVAAMEVAEEVQDCFHLREHGEMGMWEAYFCGYWPAKGHAETAPLAICRAAYLAVGGENVD